MLLVSLSSIPLKLNYTSSSTLRIIAIKNSININLNVSLLSIQNSKFKNTYSKSSPDEKPDRESRGGDNFPPPNGGGVDGGGGDGGKDDYEKKKFGAPMKFEQEAEEKGVDMNLGIVQKFILTRCLMGSGSAFGFLIRNFAMLFKVGTQIVIDSCCATFAQVQKRGKHFWDEFQLYAAVLLVGLVVDAALVGMLAPYARIGKPSVASGGLMKFLVLPTSFLKFDKPGCTFSTQLLPATLLYKGSRWALAFLTTSFAMLLDKMFRRFLPSSLDKGIAPPVMAIRQGKIQKKSQAAQWKGKSKGKLAYAPINKKNKIPPLAKKEHPAKDQACHHCGVTGHLTRNCPAYLAELKKGKSGSSNPGT